MYHTIAIECLERLPDPRTQAALLPGCLRARDNSRRVRHYKTALRKGMRLLPPSQREQLSLHYESGMRKSDIARRQNSTCSAVSKTIRAGENALRSYIELYMDIYDALEREFLREDETGGIA